MVTYLDLLPDDVYILVYKNLYRHVMGELLSRAARARLPPGNRGTNARVVYLWMNGKPGRSGSLSTNGSDIYSYRPLIGTTAGGDKLVRDYTAKGTYGYVSHTTSCHVRLLQDYTMMATHNPPLEIF